MEGIGAVQTGDFIKALGVRVVPIEGFEYRSVYVRNARVLLIRDGLGADECRDAVNHALGEMALTG